MILTTRSKESDAASSLLREDQSVHTLDQPTFFPYPRRWAQERNKSGASSCILLLDVDDARGSSTTIASPSYSSLLYDDMVSPQACDYRSSSAVAGSSFLSSTQYRDGSLRKVKSQSSNTSDRKNSKGRRRVRFCPYVTGIKIPSIYHYSLEEIHNIWITIEEFSVMHHKSSRIVELMESGRPTGKLCTRGLENTTRRGQVAKRQCRRDAYNTVIDEQDEQQRMDRYDDVAIAESYREVTASAKLWAHALGLQDRRVADSVYRQDKMNSTYLFPDCSKNRWHLH